MQKKKIGWNWKKKVYIPLMLGWILIVTNVIVFMMDMGLGLVMGIGVAIYLVVLAILITRHRANALDEWLTFAAHFGQIQKHLLQEMPFPYALTDQYGRLLWFNDEFSALTGKDRRHFKKSITGLFHELTRDVFPDRNQKNVIDVLFGEKSFEVQICSVVLNELIDDTEFLDRDMDRSYCMYSFVFHDVTEMNYYIQKYKDETMCCGLIYLDNYDEALESIEEVRRSLLTVLIDRKINSYFREVDGLVRKFDVDRYFFVIRESALRELKERRFNILEAVRTTNIGNEMAITLSIGIGANNGTYQQNSENARVAIELALGRGGDQVVVRDGQSISYYGGKSLGVEKNTRVKARVKAHALREFIDSKEKVVIMGHKLPDVDAFGSAVGIYRIAETLGKRAHIVMNEPTSSLRPFLGQFRGDAEYEDSMIISGERAEDIVDNDTLLVLVDTNKSEYTDCEELLSLTKTVVIFDHHRQSDNTIRSSVLSYIEPYASSTCEMVAEVLQYFPEKIRIRSKEADILYAGIMLDTDNFMQKTGVRTFEAAAFLRRNGADITRIRKLFRGGLEEYRLKGEVLRNVELYREHFAISVCPSEGIESPTIVASQAANDLLDIVVVKASFVLTEYRGMIFVSARSIDEVNVQIIMERLGGGGHMNMAGCQFRDTSEKEAILRLKQVIDEMLDGGELL